MPSDPPRLEQPVYRPSRGGGLDPATKRLSIIAGSIGAVLIALVGGWSLSNHAGGGIPVIEPPAGPERVKPANPGGLQLMGAEPPSAAADNGATQLAPGPETPDPQALQAELDQARKTDQPAPPPSVTQAKPVPASVPPEATPPAMAPAATKPAPTQAAAAAPATPASSPPPPTPAAQVAPGPVRSSVEVQLAALDSQTAAQAEWQRLARKDPALFGDRTPVIVEATRDGKTFYRLRTGGFASIADATGFCERSRQAGAACTIASF